QVEQACIAASFERSREGAAFEIGVDQQHAPAGGGGCQSQIQRDGGPPVSRRRRDHEQAAPALRPVLEQRVAQSTHRGNQLCCPLISFRDLIASPAEERTCPFAPAYRRSKLWK